MLAKFNKQAKFADMLYDGSPVKYVELGKKMTELTNGMELVRNDPKLSKEPIALKNEQAFYKLRQR